MTTVSTRRWRWGLATAAVTIALAVALSQVASFGRKTDTPGGSKKAADVPQLVTVSIAQTRDLPVKLTAQGHLVALNQVDIRPQASGTIRGVHFHEGDEVKAGQLLFTIDATDVAAQLARANATAAQIKAQVDDAQRDLARTQQLARSKFYSSSAVDTSLSKLEALQAQHRAALADIDNTRVLVDHTRITAPLTGLTGALSVHPGSLAQPGAAAALVNVVQIDPIGVEFTLPESALAGLLAARAGNNVRIALQTADGKSLDGKLVFVNNSVNTDTGTISLKAAFPNAAKTLWPGAYVKLTVDAGSSRGAVVLPPQAVLEGPKGRFVYALDGQDKTVSTPVTLLRIQDQFAVVDGLQGGERVVSEGLVGLKPGAAVRVANKDEPAAGASNPARQP